MERKHSPLSKFFDVVDKLEDILCGGTLVALLLVVLLQVFGRWLGKSFAWTEETTRFLFIWMMFIAVAAGFNRAESARVTVLIQVLPRFIQKFCTLLYFVFSIAFFCFMAKYGFELTMQKFAINEMGAAVALPLGFIMVCVPISGVLGVIGTIQSMLEYFKKVDIGGDQA